MLLVRVIRKLKMINLEFPYSTNEKRDNHSKIMSQRNKVSKSSNLNIKMRSFGWFL